MHEVYFLKISQQELGKLLSGENPNFHKGLMN